MFKVGRRDRIARFLTCASLALLAACSDRSPTAPISDRDRSSDLLGLLSKPRLLECDAVEFATRTVEIGPAGGIISIGGTSVEFPAGALIDRTNVTLTIPASRYVEVEVTTDGQNEFLESLPQPIVTLSYDRCNRSDLLFKPLSAWYIDSDTKELLEKQLSVEDKLTKTVTFRAGHFSGYAIAF